MSQMDADNKDPQTYAIIGAAMEVHSVLGSGFLEPVYQEAVTLELTTRGIPFKREVALPITFKSVVLSTFYRADFICYGNIIVEIKAIGRLTHIELAQVLNYLKATGFSR